MLTDMIVEEEFELKEEEPWYDKQDLEHDLQLAAELGKTLLERNRELEQGLQQMLSTNQEQLQEIEYLTKQVDLLRQVNDQHAKVYEQLDVSARELEQRNHKLVQDNRAAQQKIQGLTETTELLQTQVEELQHQVEELKLSRQPLKPALRERSSSQSVSCLKELQNTLRSDYEPDDPSDAVAWREQEQDSLRESLHSLQIQFASERALREEAEREAELLVTENAALEQQLVGVEGCRARVLELEREAEELRQLWKSESSTRSSRPDAVHNLLPHSLFLRPEEEEEEEEEGGGEEAVAAKTRPSLKRWASEKLMKAPQTPDSAHGVYDHECSCVRRAEVVKYRGISLLSEVDAQYSALQVKYDELLRRCHQGQPEDGHHHKCVQTPSFAGARTHPRDLEDDFQQPEYKELFREIFSRLQKTKEDLIENRDRPPAASARSTPLPQRRDALQHD